MTDKNDSTVEPQYNTVLDTYAKQGPITLGKFTSYYVRNDVKRFTFVLARYKFVSKMLTDYKRIIEVGCGDGFGSRLVSQTGAEVHGVDIDPIFIDSANDTEADDPNRTFSVQNYLEGYVDGDFEAAYSLDVLEHIPAEHEDTFISNVKNSLSDNGVALFGMPSLESQTHASEASKAGHVNCKSGPDLKATLKRHFDHVFLFSMNDEVVHTGFHPMAHYLLVLCTGKKS